jgi:two-component system response regulator BaeR
MGKQRVLIVEDEKKIADLLKDYLAAAGFSVSWIQRGDTAAAEARVHPPDVILLDVMLPGKDGMAVCREIRQFSNVPILMITAKVEELDRLLGLELGADDYICKPFSPREVVARVKAVLRRARPAADGGLIRVGSIVLDAASRRVTAAGGDLYLTPSEFGLLQMLMQRPGRVFTRNELIAGVQGYEFDGYDRTIDSHVKNLRKKLADRMPGESAIRTVYGVGYTLSLPEDGG